MKEILKRLEIIKNSIAIEDIEIIELQANRLRRLSLDDKSKEIVSCIENGDFENVPQMIEAYLECFSGVVVFEDKELHGLQITLKVIVRTIQELGEIKAEYLRMLREFHAEYDRRLGHLVKKILHLREDRLFQAAQQDSSYQDAFQEAKADSEKFENEYKETTKEPVIKLSKNELTELKDLYRQASRLCHPDLVKENKKRQAEEMFKVLNAAYQKGDLAAVKKILDTLRVNGGFVGDSDVINDKDLLRKKIASLRIQAASIKAEIEEIENDETFIKLQEIKDFDDYFEKIKAELIAQIEGLENERDTKTSTQGAIKNRKILDEVAKGERVCCTDDYCNGIIGIDGTCKTCGKSLECNKNNEIHLTKEKDKPSFLIKLSRWYRILIVSTAGWVIYALVNIDPWARSRNSGIPSLPRPPNLYDTGYSSHNNWGDFLLQGILPVVVLWGVIWIIKGKKKNS